MYDKITEAKEIKKENKMSLTSKMQTILAKSDARGNYLPLWMHAADTALIMEQLFAERFYNMDSICGIDYDLLKRTVKLLALLHDIGKITPLFQAKILKCIPNYRTRLENCGLDVPSESEYLNKAKSHHSLCGESILLKFGFPKGFASVVGIHHGYFKDAGCDNTRRHIENNPAPYYGINRNEELWTDLYEEWIGYSLKAAGFLNKDEIPALNKRSMVLLSGLLIMSDWIASDITKFPLLQEEDFVKDYPENRYQEAIVELKLPEVWKSQQLSITDSDFYSRFKFFMNSIQNKVVEESAATASPGIFILEAPMGVGKTEAALAAAEILASKCNKTGVFFGLPTQATANGIFERVANWAELQSEEFYHSINLVHGNAGFQPVFANMQNSIPDVDNAEGGDSGLVVHSFLSGNKQSFLSDFVVGTVDRLLMSALKKKHAMLLHLGLSQKVVIVDECHAYDAYMNVYLDRALRWLHEYNVPVILLSATLPPDRRLALINAYLGKKDGSMPEVEYPRLTYTDGDKPPVSVHIPIDAAKTEVEIITADDEMVLNEIRRAVESGACIGIICNTVLRAQSFARAARELSGARVILYHAQFTIPDRVRREDDLKKAIGKRSTAAERAGTVVVGTQVLEQSLDIDFDILITDLCPMDLLLQRIGRLHRHTARIRPSGYERAKCIVLGTDELMGASKAIYTEWLLLRTRKLLPERITVPDDIDPLVCATYKEAEPDEEPRAWGEYDFKLKEKEEKAKSFLMPAPKDSKYGNDLHNWLKNEVEGNESIARAAVRDGISSIEVIVMVKCNDGRLKCMNGDKLYSPSECPPNADCMEIAKQKLRLPSCFCYDVEATIKELEKLDARLTGFQNSHWLKGALFLLLDEDWTAQLRGYELSYSNDNGLEYKRMEDQL